MVSSKKPLPHQLFTEVVSQRYKPRDFVAGSEVKMAASATLLTESALGWSIFTVVLVVILAFCWVYIRKYQSRQESEVISTITAICALAVALITSALLPVDIFLVSFMKYPNGTYKDWAAINETRKQIEDTVLYGYYSEYFIPDTSLYQIKFDRCVSEPTSRAETGCRSRLIADVSGAIFWGRAEEAPVRGLAMLLLDIHIINSNASFCTTPAGCTRYQIGTSLKRAASGPPGTSGGRRAALRLAPALVPGPVTKAKRASWREFLIIALYSIVLFCVFFWIPFVYFYYEEKDEDNVSKCSQVKNALKYTIGFVIVCAALLLIGTFVPLPPPSRQNSTQWEKVQYLFKELGSRAGSAEGSPKRSSVAGWFGAAVIYQSGPQRLASNNQAVPNVAGKPPFCPRPGGPPEPHEDVASSLRRRPAALFDDRTSQPSSLIRRTLLRPGTPATPLRSYPEGDDLRWRGCTLVLHQFPDLDWHAGSNHIHALLLALGLSRAFPVPCSRRRRRLVSRGPSLRPFEKFCRKRVGARASQKMQGVTTGSADDGGRALACGKQRSSLCGAVCLYAYGMSALPLTLIKGVRSVRYERLENTEDTEQVEQRIGKLKAKCGDGRPLSMRDRRTLQELETRLQTLRRQARHLEVAERDCCTKVGGALRPLKILLGVFFFLVALLFVAALFISNLDKALHSAGINTGFVIFGTNLTNPLNELLLALQPVFPLDYVLITVITVYFVFTSMAGIRNMGIWFFWMRLYKIRPERTRPQALLFLCMILLLIVLHTSYMIYSLAPQYVMYGSQKYQLQTPQTTAVTTKICDADAPEGVASHQGRIAQQGTGCHRWPRSTRNSRCSERAAQRPNPRPGRGPRVSFPLSVVLTGHVCQPQGQGACEFEQRHVCPCYEHRTSTTEHVHVSRRSGRRLDGWQRCREEKKTHDLSRLQDERVRLLTSSCRLLPRPLISQEPFGIDWGPEPQSAERSFCIRFVFWCVQAVLGRSGDLGAKPGPLCVVTAGRGRLACAAAGRTTVESHLREDRPDPYFSRTTGELQREEEGEGETERWNEAEVGLASEHPPSAALVLRGAPMPLVLIQASSGARAGPRNSSFNHDVDFKTLNSFRVTCLFCLVFFTYRPVHDNQNVPLPSQVLVLQHCLLLWQLGFSCKEKVPAVANYIQGVRMQLAFFTEGIYVYSLLEIARAIYNLQ
ncbi:hypothetical protein P4O66_012643, partial [Electrophorus voltai]